MDILNRYWSNVVTIACISISAFVQAWQQATKDLPTNVHLPRLEHGWNYIPLVLLIVAGVVWLISRIASSDKQAPHWKTKEHWRLKSEAQTSEMTNLQQTHAEEIRKCQEKLQESANRNLEYKARLAIFSSLQIEALTVADDLRKFADEIEDGPVYNGDLTVDAHLAWAVSVRAPFDESVRAKYELYFRKKLDELYLHLKTKQICVDELKVPPSPPHLKKEIRHLATCLWEAASKIGTMGQDELDLSRPGRHWL